MTDKEKAITEIFKTAKERYPDNLLFAVPNALTKKLKSFMLIREDLLFVSRIAEKLISLKSSPDFDAEIELALWQSIVITYGKCFTENKAGMSKLEKSLLEKLSDKYQYIHDHLIDLRHRYVAHRDDTAHEQAMVFIKIPENGRMLDPEVEDIIISRKLASPRIGNIESFIELLSFLIKETDARIQTHGDKTHNAFLQKISPEQARFFLVNNMKLD